MTYVFELVVQIVGTALLTVFVDLFRMLLGVDTPQ